MKFILYCSIICVLISSQAQAFTTDTLKIMSYNTLNYGFQSSSSCPGLLSFKKHKYLREILKYAKPDILGLVKMSASPSTFTTDTIPNKVLDSVCYHCYAHTPFTNNSGYIKENMIYYRKDKVKYVSTTTLYSGDKNISDINLHRFYYLAPDLGSTSDTQYINIILVHLLSGSSNDNERGTEIKGAVTYLGKHFPNLKNYIFMGDFNTQSSNEKCYQYLVSPSDTNYRFYDPVNKPGNWNSSPDKFSMYLTQATRYSDLNDCGASGGMNERFDHILLSHYLMEGIDSVKYVQGSFKVIGQDGNHTNSSIDTPINKSAPANIINDLYFMSSHLPVELKLAVSSKSIQTALENQGSNPEEIHFSNIRGDNNLTIYFPEGSPNENENISFELFDLSGKKIHMENIQKSRFVELHLPQLSKGVYIARLSTERGLSTSVKLIK